MKKTFNLFKIGFFLFGLIALWLVAENILQAPKSSDWDTKSEEKAREKEDYYDVLICGTSIALTNVSAEELYLKYGIASLSLGKPEQMTFLSYYSLEEALKYQSPKAVLFDVQAMFYSEEHQKEGVEDNADYLVHYTLDGMKNSGSKNEAVRQVEELDPTAVKWEYVSKMFYSHANWEDLGQDYFRESQGKDLIMGSRGLTDIFENMPIRDILTEDMEAAPEALPELNRKYLQKMKDLCDANGVELILLRGYGSLAWTWAQYNAIVDVAEELGVTYLDLSVSAAKIDFDMQTDSNDGSHHNLIGSKKWTDYIGEYLTEHFDFEDRREDAAYQEYEDAGSQYEELVSAMEQKISLISATDLNQYLEALQDLEPSGNAIFISVSDEASGRLSENSVALLESVGFHMDLRDEYRYSYYGVLDDGELIAEDRSESGVQTAGLLSDGTAYEIASGGLTSGLAAGILVNGEEQIQGGRGINIVVYNKDTEMILSSVFFDTCAEENPLTSRINENGEVEQETAVNYWE